ncbi:large polymerase protein [avian paramyxovirus 8]|uniref:RNA-directed RNA polymerase L n=1 Tax=avian paramyxovirus 8 TaxID=2560318 RepID=C3TWQ1_9MONO|nr:large polymerase protein [Avian metaavulavirus 8]ACO48302.2 large polymerase protein [Avian metaavulavirus 8]
MDIKQVDLIIQPEVHLDSPIILNKLALLWRLSGLPMPADLRQKSVVMHIPDHILEKSEYRIKHRLGKIKSDITHYCQYFNINLANLDPITHPKSLYWLSRLTIASAGTFRHMKDRILCTVGSEFGHKIQDLFSLLSHKLVGNGDLFNQSLSGTRLTASPLSPLCDQFVSDIKSAVTTPWSEARWSWLHIKQTMRYLIKQSCTTNSAHLTEIIKEEWGLVGITPDLVILFDRVNNSLTALTFEMVLMYSDVLESRDNIVLVGRLSTFLQPVVSRLEVLFDLVDSLAKILGDTIYEIIAVLESLSYGSVQLHDASHSHAGSFFSFNMNELDNTLSKRVDPKHKNTIMSIIRQCFSNLDVDQAAEMLCLMRLFGHPMLTAPDAAAKVRKAMCAPKLVEHDTILQTLSFFKGIIINGYRRSHSGLWPNVEPSSIYDDDLRQLYLESAEISHHFMLKNYKSLSMIEFKKSIDYDLHDDLSTFLKDRAICRPKSQWDVIFRKSLRRSHTQSQYLDEIKSNRLLIDFLDSAEFDPEKEFAYVTTMDYLHDNEFCASYSLKEKEIKTTGRIFAKMTRNMRSCQVILESLLSKHICKFFKENGVSMEQLSLTKSLLAMSQLSPKVSTLQDTASRHVGNSKSQIATSNPSRHHSTANQMSLSNRKTVVATFLTTDLEKYCLQWRYSTIKLFAQALNQLFGIDHGFEWIHLRLMNSTLFVGDPYSPPEDPTLEDIDKAPNDDIFIVSPRGGIEGLCQKMWTMISISAIHCVAEKIGARVAAMVQGDNQVIAITKELFRGEKACDVRDELDELGQVFFDEFKRHNYAIGHNLKLNETIQSQSFFVYSKRIFFEGRLLSQVLKNAAKLCMVADHLGENTVSSCSNLSSTIARLVENGFEKDTAFVLNLVYIMTQILFDEHYSIVCDHHSVKSLIGSKNHRNLLYSSLIPGQLGGFNFLNISRLFTRNIGDPVTCSLSDLKCFIAAGLLPPYVLKNVVLREPGPGTWLTLCSDPYTLNIPYTQLPTTYLKKHTQRSLLSRAVNPLLAGVQVPNQHEEEEVLARFLLDREYVMPRVAHVILETSVLGKRKQIQGLIDTTPTIIRTSLVNLPVSRKKCEKIINYSLNYIAECHDSLLSQVCFSDNKEYLWSTSLISVETCSVTIADYLRAVSWSNILGGRNISGVTTPDTIELIQGCLIGENSSCTLCESHDDAFTWMHLPGPLYIPEPSVTNSKMRVPYLGSKTEERKTASMAAIKGMSHHLRAVLRGTSVFIWAFGDTDINWDNALQIAQSRCNITLDQMRLLTPIPSSSNIQHRLDDGISTQKFTPASLARITSFVHICNDSQRLEKDGSSVDSNLIYQQIMLLGLSIFETMYSMDQKWVFNNHTLHLHTGHSCCPRELDISLVNPPRHQTPELTSTTTNPFLYDQLPLNQENLTTLEIKTFKFNELNIDGLDFGEGIQLLSRCTARLMAECILEEGIGSSVKNEAIVNFDNSVNWISECLMCDIRSLCVNLGQEILCSLAYQMYYLRIRGRRAILNYLDTTLQRIPVIQLANIALTISHPEIFRRIVNTGIHNQIKGPYVATTDFIAASRDIILSGAREYLSYLSSGQEDCYTFFNCQDGDLTPKMEQYLARRACLLTLLYNTGHQIPVIRSLTPIEKCKVLTEYNQQIEYADQEFSSVLKVVNALLQNPKIDALVSNLYFTTRRVLSNLRSCDKARSYIEYLYTEDFGEKEDTVQYDIMTTNDIILTHGLFTQIEISYQGNSLHKFLTPDNAPGSLIPFSISPNSLACDPLHHLLKSVGTSSTSWYKYAIAYAVSEKRSARLGGSLYIGEGSGSVMTLLEYLEPSVDIFYNSLFSNGMNPPQRNYGLMPLQFVNSVVYKNLTAKSECKLGFVQQFKPLWRDIDIETNVTDPSFVNFALNEIPMQSLKRVNCVVEFDRGMPIERVIQGYTHILLVATYGLQQDSILWVKVYRTSEKVFQFLLSAMIMIFGYVKIHRNGYMSTKEEEYILMSDCKEPVNYTAVPNILTRVSDLVSKNLSLIHPEDLRKVRCETDSLNLKCNHIYEKIIARKIPLQVSSTDSLLLQLGGVINSVGSTDPREVATLSSIECMDYVVSSIDLAILEANIVISESAGLDLALMLGPFNLNKLKKIDTILKSSTYQLIPYWLRYEYSINPRSLSFLITKLQQCRISWSDMITISEFRKKSKRPIFIKRVIGNQQLKSFFNESSSIVLTRAEVKVCIKFLGAIIKLK